MNKSLFCFVTLIAAAQLSAAEKLNYRVSFWRIHCVDVAMVREESQNDKMKLEFSAKTRPVFDYFFSVDNSYTTWYDVKSFEIHQYSVEVNQPNADFSYKLKWNDERKKFSTSNISYSRPEKSHNILTLLMRARNLPWEELDTIWWSVEHEGAPYRGRYLWVDSSNVQVGNDKILADHYRLDLEDAQGDKVELSDVKDIFSWGIVLDGAVRQVWVERDGARRILRAEVNVRGITLTAELNSD
tara:strand:- start:34403 stop:35128 length:726 start_codon:yes stop_codon:yes gene_type:complete